MQELRHYIEAFSSLHTAKVKGVKAPHKAVSTMPMSMMYGSNCYIFKQIRFLLW